MLTMVTIGPPGFPAFTPSAAVPPDARSWRTAAIACCLGVGISDLAIAA
jgi:hypothetical protein